MSEDHLEAESIPFYPDHIRTEIKVVAGILFVAVLIGLWGLIHPIGLEEPADPMNTPLHVKPEWYFLALYQLLKFIPKTAGAVTPVLAIAVLMLWPFIDRKADRTPRARRNRMIFVSILMLILIVLTIWGEVS